MPHDHPLTTGGIGLLGTRQSEEAMEAADTLFMVVSAFAAAIGGRGLRAERATDVEGAVKEAHVMGEPDDGFLLCPPIR